MSEEKNILDRQSLRAEGIKIGRKESEAEIAQKEAEIAQNKKEIARNFKASGVSLDIIAKNTGLTLEEIAEL